MEQQSSGTNDVKEFIMKSKIRLQKILDRLNWSEEGVLKNFNSNSVDSATSHKPNKICPPKIITYPDSLVATNSLTIETPELQLLLKNDQIEAPQNFRDLQANFSREEKLQIYEHVIGHTEKLENNTVPKVADGEISLTEIFSQKKREEKRKKRKFRISKPTHIEEVRNLVDLQMQALLQFIGNQQEKTLAENITKDRCHSERKRSRSRDHHRRNEYNDPSPKRIKSRRRSISRSKDRTYESNRRYTDRTNHKRSRSRSYDHRKRSRSRETNKNRSRKSYRKESETYDTNRYKSPTLNRRRDYDNNYYRRESISPHATSSRHHDKRSSYTSRVHDTEYDNDDRKYKQDKEKYYSKHESNDKYKQREHKSLCRHRSEERDEKRSKHKRKKHKKDHS